MARRLMTRLSSASMEPDCIPPMVPFDWEAAPGRPETVKTEIAAAPALPLPPGRRPKDGPISRPAQVRNEEDRIDSSRRDRRSFHLKFPRVLKKSRKVRKIREDVEDSGSVFNPLSGHRFGSRVARRVLVESQKNSPCFGECLSGGRKESVDHHRGTGLDSAEDSDGDEHNVTPRSSGSSRLSSPRHGQTRRNSLTAGAGTHSQVPSSRFNMASMLQSLCPESDGSDGDEVRISERLAPVSRNRKLQQARPGFTNKSNAMIQSWSTPWSSSGSSDCSFVTSCSLDDPKAGVVSASFATPTAEFSPFRRNPFEERLEPNQPPPTRPISSLPQISLQNQAGLHIAKGKAVRIEDKKVPNNWLEELQSSSLWPQKMSAHDDAGKGDNGDESGEDFESSSSHSFDYRTPRAGSSIPSPNSPVLNTFSKPAIKCVVVSKEVLKSSSLLQRKLQRQQCYESPRRSFMLDQETTTAPSPSTAFEQNNVLTHAPNSSDHASKGENPAVLPASRLSETSNSSSGVISKAAQGESKAGVGSSGESFPIHRYYHWTLQSSAKLKYPWKLKRGWSPKCLERCLSRPRSNASSSDNSTAWACKPIPKVGRHAELKLDRVAKLLSQHLHILVSDSTSFTPVAYDTNSRSLSKNQGGSLSHNDRIILQSQKIISLQSPPLYKLQCHSKINASTASHDTKTIFQIETDSNHQIYLYESGKQTEYLLARNNLIGSTRRTIRPSSKRSVLESKTLE